MVRLQHEGFRFCFPHSSAAAPSYFFLQDFAEVLQEAAAAAGGRLRQVPDGAAAFQLPQACGPQHRAVQYVSLLGLLQEQKGG